MNFIIPVDCRVIWSSADELNFSSINSILIRSDNRWKSTFNWNRIRRSNRIPRVLKHFMFFTLHCLFSSILFDLISALFDCDTYRIRFSCSREFNLEIFNFPRMPYEHIDKSFESAHAHRIFFFIELSAGLSGSHFVRFVENCNVPLIREMTKWELNVWFRSNYVLSTLPGPPVDYENWTATSPTNENVRLVYVWLGSVSSVTIGVISLLLLLLVSRKLNANGSVTHSKVSRSNPLLGRKPISIWQRVEKQWSRTLHFLRLLRILDRCQKGCRANDRVQCRILNGPGSWRRTEKHLE